jgi:hypothetical protein
MTTPNFQFRIRGMTTPNLQFRIRGMTTPNLQFRMTCISNPHPQFTTKVVLLNTAKIKFVSDLRQVGGTVVLSEYSGSTISKIDRHDINEILLTVALITTNQTNLIL